MRLLVYGGNEHNVRCEIGSWQLPDKGSLSDTYGIPKDGWSFGFGILNERGFLFLKTLKTADARTYPFTILFDPGEEIWNKFGWNAAHLAFSLLSKDNRFQNELLEIPEFFNIQILEKLIQNLKLYEFEPRESKVSYLIAGTVFEKDRVIVPSANFSPSILSPAQVAEQIEALPPFLRTGNGWLFGGSSANAAGLGMNLVFDANFLTAGRDTIDKIIEKGAWILQSLKKAGVETRSALNRFSKVPSWQWEKTFKTQPVAVFKGLSILSELENRSSITDDDLAFLDVDRGLLFDDEIRRILLKLACKTDRVLSPYRTKFLLDKYFERSLPAEKLPIKYLHLKTYQNWLAINSKFPSESGLTVQLQPYHYFEVCQRIISLEPDLKKIPLLFHKSVAELRKNGAEEFIDSLSETILEKTSHKLGEIWFDVAEQDYFKTFLAIKFEKKAREMVKNKYKDWVNLYLRFANDRGGDWLLKNTSREQARFFIEQLVKHLQKFPRSRTATVWLQALTVSPLRNELTNEEKITISRLTAELTKSWRNFITLMDILEVKGNTLERLDSPDEEIFLRKELKEFLRENPNADLAAIKPPLKIFFGEFPDEFVDEVNRLGRSVLQERKENLIENKAELKKPEEKKIRGDKITNYMGYKCPLCLNELTVQDNLIRYCYQCDRADFVKITPESLRSNLKCKKSYCQSHGQIQEGVFFAHLECEKPNPFWNGQQLNIPANAKIDGKEITLPFNDADNSYNSFKHWQINLFNKTIGSKARVVNGTVTRNVSAMREMWFPAELLRATGERRMGKKTGQIVALVGTRYAGKTFLALQILDREGYLHPTNFNARVEIDDYIYSYSEETLTIQPIFVLLRLRYFMQANRSFPPLQGTPRKTLNFYTAFFSPSQKALQTKKNRENISETAEPEKSWWEKSRDFVLEFFAPPSHSQKPFYYTLALCDVAGEDVKQEVAQIDAVKKGVDKIALVIDSMELEGDVEREKILAEHISGLEKLIKNKKNKPFCIVLTKMDLFAKYLDDNMAFNYDIKQNYQNFYSGNQAVIKDLLRKWRQTIATDNSKLLRINLLRLLNEIVSLDEDSPVFMVETQNLPTDPNAIIEKQPLSSGIDTFVCWCLEIERSEIIEER